MVVCVDEGKEKEGLTPSAVLGFEVDAPGRDSEGYMALVTKLRELDELTAKLKEEVRPAPGMEVDGAGSGKRPGEQEPEDDEIDAIIAIQNPGIDMESDERLVELRLQAKQLWKVVGSQKLRAGPFSGSGAGRVRGPVLLAGGACRGSSDLLTVSSEALEA